MCDRVCCVWQRMLHVAVCGRVSHVALHAVWQCIIGSRVMCAWQ